eukprot:TRINITY_DN51010_c0_g1_i1.p1 TRINITY_DN51010_c0_g1~~TRINITY_DN51010_c0_g1_i1.p1  ORF type:complete len:273 (-),score=16.04 TRINITY_DN51010_c0_g1_i1:168-986(-)
MPSVMLFPARLTRVASLLLHTTLVFDVSSTDSDGPARFDLAVDLRGQWLYDSHDGCEEYMEITGTSHFSAGKQVCTLLPLIESRQLIWQDCLEMTISGSSKTSSLSPLHHMVLDGKYLTDDWTAAGIPTNWTSKIVPRTSMDVDAASAVVVFEIGAELNMARRYIDTKGRLVQGWKASANGTAAWFRIKYVRERILPCNGYDPALCSGRSYNDGVGAKGWTPSCCLASYGDHQENPNKRSCADDPASEAYSASTLVFLTTFVSIMTFAHIVL